MIELVSVGDSKQFEYTGNIQHIELLPGKYKIECYGAQGQSFFNGIGGKGGYAQGILTIHDKETLYVCVGGWGQNADNGGYNGGEGGQPGGGATHVAKRTGLLKTLADYKDDVIIVAGGGGGAERTRGGDGGGLVGGDGSGSYSSIISHGKGGTQTTGGAAGESSNYGLAAPGGFGYGGVGDTWHDYGPTGGGGWYGGGGVTYAGGAGGGSSYIGHRHLTETSTTPGLKEGNGYAIITVIDLNDAHKVHIVNGILSENRKYLPNELVNISFNYHNADKVFSHWYSQHVTFDNLYNKNTFFIMPASDVYIEGVLKNNRINSNIYKNIFPEIVMNMEYINNTIINTPTSTEDIIQENHGLEQYDAVYLDSDGKYKKAFAENSTRATVEGLVSKIAGPNVFTLINTGKIEYSNLEYNDTSILYLSDKIPGKLVHYSDIKNTIYIPVAIYTNNSIIVNIQQGSIGSILAPYAEEEGSFELYTEQELNDIVNEVVNGVKNSES